MSSLFAQASPATESGRCRAMHKFCELYAWPSVVEQPVLELLARKMMSSLLGQVFLYCLFMVSASHAQFFRGCPIGRAPGSWNPGACQPAIGTWHLSTQQPANQPSAPGVCRAQSPESAKG